MQLIYFNSIGSTNQGINDLYFKQASHPIEAYICIMSVKMIEILIKLSSPDDDKKEYMYIYNII